MREAEAEAAPGRPARTSVAADMEAIFGDAADRPEPVRQAAAPTALVLPPAAPAGPRRAALVGALLLAASGGVIGLASWRDERPARVSVAAIPLAPPKPLPKPVTIPPARHDVDPLPVPTATASAIPFHPELGAARLGGTSDPAPDRRGGKRRGPTAEARPDPRAGEDEDASGPGPCSGLRGGDHYACTLDALAAADGRLRRAYDTAVVTGMPRRDLIAVRERWAFLRRDASRRPFWVIAHYRALADELETASSRAR